MCEGNCAGRPLGGGRAARNVNPHVLFAQCPLVSLRSFADRLAMQSLLFQQITDLPQQYFLWRRWRGSCFRALL